MFCRNARLCGDIWFRKSWHNNEVIIKNQGHIRRAFQERRSAKSLKPDKFELFAETHRPVNARGLVKPLLFAVGVSTASVVGCSIWQYEETLLRHNKGNNHKYKTRTDNPITKWWNSLRESEKVYYPILGANVLVFAAWRVRSLAPVLVKYFCSNPAGTAVCTPMVLSTFSHYAFLHLAANMYVLYTFMPAAVMSLGKEQFLAMYLSAGVFSSLASFIYKTALAQPGLSLGASGAIMGVLSYVCVQFPETKLSIIFLPMYTFAAGTAIKFIMGLDFAGVVLGWRFFDHAAHLGGALFGIAWCYWGREFIWGKRHKFLQYYHDFRTS